jgi:hypothetical protein
MATETPLKTDAAGEEPARALVVPPRREFVPYTFTGAISPMALYFDSAAFDQAQRTAVMFSKAAIVPAFFRDKPADCFLVLVQAARWGMDPFAVFSHVYMGPGGKLGYEGKLVGALINADPNVVGMLKPTYFGEKGTPGFGVVLSARLRNESEDRIVRGTVGEWATKNEKWTSIPDQMLVYRGSRDWARRHLPHVLLGVRTREELEGVIDVEEQDDGSFAVPPSPPPPPTPAARLDAVTEKLKAEKAKEPATILEGQLKKSLEMMKPHPAAVQEQREQRERVAAKAKLEANGQLCLHHESKQLSTGEVVCAKCDTVLFEKPAAEREPGEEG